MNPAASVIFRVLCGLSSATFIFFVLVLFFVVVLCVLAVLIIFGEMAESSTPAWCAFLVVQALLGR